MATETTNTTETASIDKAISTATGNLRRWDRKQCKAAYKACRPFVESEMRQQGKAFTKDELRTKVRTCVASYAGRYGVVLPQGTAIAGTELESVAADVCGVFGLSWTDFFPGSVQKVLKLAKGGDKHAQAALKKLFGKGSQAAAPAVSPTPARAPAAATEAAPAASAAGSSDSLGAWLHKLNPAYWIKSADERKFIDAEKQAWIDNAAARKQLGKREEVLTQAEKAKTAKESVAQAQARAAEVETQLKAIESQLAGACVGKEDILGKDLDDRKENPFGVDEEDAAPVLRKVKKAKDLAGKNRSDLTAVCEKMQKNLPISPEESAKVLQLLARNEELHTFRKALVSGELYAKNPSRKAIAANVVMGAVKAMTPTERQMVVQISQMAKQGNPNAQKALAVIRAQGYSVMGDDSGSFISDAFNAATAPLKFTYQYGIKKPVTWAARQLGITKGGGSSPEQVRLQRLRAAVKRRQAAEARARAADAQSEAEYRVQQQVAAAADAEADAADAEASAKEAAMMTAEAEFAPGTTDESGRGPEITPLPPTPPAPNPAVLAKKAYLAKKNPRAAALLAKSEEQSPEGMKLKASMALYKASKKRGSKENKAVRAMIAKAKKGDPQARADVLALKAARQAVIADKRAARHVAIVARYKAIDAAGKAKQKRFEAAMADKLVRRSRARKLAKVARIERRAAAGDKKSQAIVKRVVTRAKAGDKNAIKTARALKLAQYTRKATKTARERRNLRAAARLVRKAQKGNKRALVQLRTMNAAAKHGNPNARRGMSRVRTAAAWRQAVATGAIALPAGVALTIEERKRAEEKRKQNLGKVANVQSKLDKGKRVTREEAMEAAKAAHDAGDAQTAGALSAEASRLPSAQNELKRVASVAAASEAGNPAAMQSLGRASMAAEAGEAGGIAAMGALAGVKAMDQVRKGKDIDPGMKEAVRDVEAAQQGDPEARAKIAAMSAKAEEKDPKAIKYMVEATGATVIARALAGNEAAKEQWLAKAGVKKGGTENEEVKLVPDEGPDPRSTLGIEEPLPPIKGFLSLVKESVRALLGATSDPLANYRQGVIARGRVLGSADTAGGAEKAKKDPEAKYRVHAQDVPEKVKLDPEEQVRVHGDAKTPGKDPELAELVRDVRAASGNPAALRKLLAAWGEDQAKMTRLEVKAASGSKPAAQIVVMVRKVQESKRGNAVVNGQSKAVSQVHGEIGGNPDKI